jgi:hypothetical protein
MKIDEIEQAVQEFRASETVKVHNRLNATAPRDQHQERVATEMRAVDARADTYRASLGVPDDQPEPTQSIAQEPTEQASVSPVFAVVPGKKA